MSKQHPNISPYTPRFTKPVEVTYLFSIPDKRRRDLGNMFKSTDDFMVSYGVLLDDSLIHKIAAEWTTQGAGVLIRVSELGEKQ